MSFGLSFIILALSLSIHTHSNRGKNELYVCHTRVKEAADSLAACVCGQLASWDGPKLMRRIFLLSKDHSFQLLGRMMRAYDDEYVLIRDTSTGLESALDKIASQLARYTSSSPSSSTTKWRHVAGAAGLGDDDHHHH